MGGGHASVRAGLGVPVGAYRQSPRSLLSARSRHGVAIVKMAAVGSESGRRVLDCRWSQIDPKPISHCLIGKGHFKFLLRSSATKFSIPVEPINTLERKRIVYKGEELC